MDFVLEIEANQILHLVPVFKIGFILDFGMAAMILQQIYG